MGKDLEFLYYTETQSATQYTLRPTGSIDLQRLIGSQPDFWISPDLQTQEKPKHLIFADWRVNSYSKEQINKINRALIALKKQGFSIDYWQDNSLHPLKIPLIDGGVNPFNESIPLPQTLLKKASEATKKPVDQLMLLDDYWMDAIIDDKPAHRGLKLSDCWRAKLYSERHGFTSVPKIDMNYLLEWLKHASPTPDSFHIDMVVSENPELIAFYEKIQESIGIRSQITECGTTDHSGTKINIKNLQELLEANPKIRSLNLYLCPNIGGVLELQHVHETKRSAVTQSIS